MAIPIKETPVLKGKDAKNFEKMIESNPTQVSVNETKVIKDMVSEILKKAKI